MPGFADSDGSKLPQENPVPATSWTISSSKMSKIQRHAAAQVAWTLFQFSVRNECYNYMYAEMCIHQYIHIYFSLFTNTSSMSC